MSWSLLSPSSGPVGASRGRRSLMAVLIAGVLLLSGCYYHADYSYSISVTAVADNQTVISTTPVSLTSEYDFDNVTVYIDDQDWSVTSAPAGAVFTFYDDGRDATLIPTSVGTYVVRYRTWYYTNYDYDYCLCTYATGYRESYITITVIPAPST
ncbi:MAG: hypothetical protein H0W78_11865 [Planctomycetes bacterium]|nr:hypothetical protein [Planctomycetota bacterium]